MRSVFILCGVILCGFLFTPEVSAQQNPPPVFESDYQLPPTETPQPHLSIALRNSIAVGVYVLLLLSAIIAVYYLRSRVLIFSLTIISVLILGLWLHGCPCPIGALQSVAVALVSPETILAPTILILFLLPILLSLFYGRIFCSAVCPIGAVQELICLFPQRIPAALDNALSLFRYVYLGLAILLATHGIGFLLCSTDPIVSIFRMSGRWDLLLETAAFLLIGVFIGRPYCRFLCPYGLILGWCSRLAAQHVRVAPDKCSQCNLCEKCCPYQAILPPTLPLTSAARQRGPRQLVAMILLAPFIVILFAWLGAQCAFPLSQYHPHLIRAEKLLAERSGLVDEISAETMAWTQRNASDENALELARDTMQQFAWSATFLGGFIGVVIATHGVLFTLRRRRTEYEADPARCVACGRCFWYCPQQSQRRVLLDEETNKA